MTATGEEMGGKEQFGAFIRRKREENELGLREMAKNAAGRIRSSTGRLRRPANFH